MKRFLLILVGLAITHGCKKDSSPASGPPPPTYTRVFIDRVTVDEIPFVDGSGVSWDVGSGPDLMFYIVDSLAVAQFGPSTVINDLTPSSLPVQWTFITPFEITNWGRARYLALWDYDVGTANDFIGYSGGFRVSNLSGYPTSVSLPNGTIQARVTLRWQ